MASEEDVRIEIVVDDPGEAQRLEQALTAGGASDVTTTRKGEPGIAPILIIVGAVAGVTALADLVMRWRKAHMCQEVIDARGDAVKVSKDCSIRDGRIIVVSKDGQQVEIHDVPDGIDVTKIVEAAIKSGADAVKAAAAAAGAKASDPQPATEPASGG
jgi:poly(3-hydroxybutyrate) depolymerase